MQDKILQIIPAPTHMRAAYIDTDNIDGPLIFNKLDFLALVEDEKGRRDVMAMFVNDSNIADAPHTASNFVAICTEGIDIDPAEVELHRERVRAKEQEREESRAAYLAEKAAAANI